MYEILNNIKIEEITKTQASENRKIAIKNGNKTYIGNPCSICNKSLRYIGSYNCVNCLKYIPTNKPRSEILPERKEAIEKGKSVYFTGKPCKNGHISNRLVKGSTCVECKNTNFKFKRREKERQYSVAKYKITLNQYELMLKNQNFVCKICEQPEISLTGKGDKIKPLAIDHCHDTGKIRGLLCSRCNIGIGSLKHNPELIRKAALYCEQT